MFKSAEVRRYLSREVKLKLRDVHLNGTTVSQKYVAAFFLTGIVILHNVKIVVKQRLDIVTEH